MMLTVNTAGARLAYVVVPIKGTVKRPVTSWTKKDGLKTKDVEQPAGYMVYFPRGHCLRFRNKDHLRQYGLDVPPRIVNLSGLNDPNSPIGKMLMAQDEATRKGAMASLEQQVIMLATAKTGPVLMPEQVEAEAGME